MTTLHDVQTLISRSNTSVRQAEKDISTAYARAREARGFRGTHRLSLAFADDKIVEAAQYLYDRAFAGSSWGGPPGQVFGRRADGANCSKQSDDTTQVTCQSSQREAEFSLSNQTPTHARGPAYAWGNTPAQGTSNRCRRISSPGVRGGGNR